ncbi:MAG: alpha/beta hydrolase [Campylobacter sp.]
MKKVSLILCAVFSAVLISCATAKGVENVAGELILSGEQKQAYISAYMDKIFHPSGAKSAFEIPQGWQQQRFKVGSAYAEHMHSNAKRGDRVILQLHGGGYVLGLSDAHRLLGVKQAELAGASDVYYSDYRLAPQNTYPAALQDAIALYEELLNRKISAKNIILIGDSAGGNLAVELALYLKEHNLPRPGVIVLVSPWASMEVHGASRSFNESKDQVLGKSTPLFEPVKKAEYIGSLDRKDPRVSPVYADLSGLAPTLIQAGGNELFLSECEELAKKFAADGVEVSLSVYAGMPHDFALLLPQMRESVNSLQEIADFANRYMR